MNTLEFSLFDRRSLSDVVCWTRVQSEAGQALEAIVRRKNLEREAGNGFFCWGVGNAPGLAISNLATAGSDVDVVFSLMKGRPQRRDSNPSSILVWRSYIDKQGMERELADHILVTSRGASARGGKRVHYALMCKSEAPLDLKDLGPFDHKAYRNVSGIGGAIGASQVTALIRRVSDESSFGEYRVNMRAKLIESYWVKLCNSVAIKSEVYATLTPSRVSAFKVDEWRSFVTEVRSKKNITDDFDRRLL